MHGPWTAFFQPGLRGREDELRVGRASGAPKEFLKGV